MFLRKTATHSDSTVTADRNRVHVHLINRAEFISLLVASVALLFFFYPKTDLKKRLHQVHADYISEQYLHQLAHYYPKQAQWTFLLAKHHIARNDFKRAKTLLAPYLQHTPQNDDDWDAHLINYQLLETKIHQQNPNSTAFSQGIEALQTQLTTMQDGPWTTAEMSNLATKSLAVGAPLQSLYYYQRLLAKTAQPTATLYASAGKVAIFSAKYRTAADFYFKAMPYANNYAKKRAYFIDALRTLEAGELHNEALAEAIERLRPFNNDNKVLIHLIRLALAANRPDLASFYAKKALLFTEEQS